MVDLSISFIFLLKFQLFFIPFHWREWNQNHWRKILWSEGLNLTWTISLLTTSLRGHGAYSLIWTCKIDRLWPSLFWFFHFMNVYICVCKKMKNVWITWKKSFSLKNVTYAKNIEVSGLFGKNFECVTHNQGEIWYVAHLKCCSTFYYLTSGYIGEKEIRSRKYLRYSGLCFPSNLSGFF